MNISSNTLVTLDYDPAKDILSDSLPDIRQFALGEVQSSLQTVVDAVASYDIKKMLLNSSNAIIEVDSGEYRSLIMHFSQDLANTRLRWLARVASREPLQELRASLVMEEVQQMVSLPVGFRNFLSTQEAMEWLESVN